MQWRGGDAWPATAAGRFGIGACIARTDAGLQRSFGRADPIGMRP
jgi:hypothetical protein